MLRRSQERGAIGPGDLTTHARHAAGFLVAARAATPPSKAWSVPRQFLDLGSGGGLPGLVIAAIEPTARGTLLDGRTERGRLLEEHVRSLGFEARIEVRAARAELAGRSPELRGSFDLVVARGFGPPPVTAECAAPFLAAGGLLVVSEPPDDDAARWPVEPLAVLGLLPLEAPVTVDLGGQRARYRVLSQVAPCPARWPRRTGIPAKRPLYAAS